MQGKLISAESSIPDYVRSYFLDSSPSATLVMELQEEQLEKSRKKVKVGTGNVDFNKRLDAERESQRVEVKAQERHDAETEA